MASNVPIKTIKLRGSDKIVFEVPEAILASQSDLVKDKIARGIRVEYISVPNTTAEVLAKVIAYCEKHAAADATKTENEKAQEGSNSTTPASDEELDNWDQKFIDVDLEMISKIQWAAQYLDIIGLVVLTCNKYREEYYEKEKGPGDI